jgi:AGCS family alanine or glycine:cation symporter
MNAQGNLSLCLVPFLFSTILGWSFYGEKAAEYLFGPKVNRYLPPALGCGRHGWVGGHPQGRVVVRDIANGLMAIPNLISLIALSGVAGAETRRYIWSDNLDGEG